MAINDTIARHIIIPSAAVHMSVADGTAAAITAVRGWICVATVCSIDRGVMELSGCLMPAEATAAGPKQDLAGRSSLPLEVRYT